MAPIPKSWSDVAASACTKANTSGMIRGRSGAPNKWKIVYTYEDLSRLTGLKDSTLKKMKSLGEFDPCDLESVVEFVIECRRKARDR